MTCRVEGAIATPAGKNSFSAKQKASLNHNSLKVNSATTTLAIKKNR